MDHTELYNFCKKHHVRNLEIKYSGEPGKYGIPGNGNAICELEIAQDDLINLIEFEAKARGISKLLDEEKEIRDRCKSAQKAYDEYQLLLILAKKGTTE